MKFHELLKALYDTPPGTEFKSIGSTSGVRIFKANDNIYFRDQFQTQEQAVSLNKKPTIFGCGWWSDEWEEVKELIHPGVFEEFKEELKNLLELYGVPSENLTDIKIEFHNGGLVILPSYQK